MLYAFTLKRNTAALLVAGCAVAVILTFVAGLLIGAHVRATHDLMSASFTHRTMLESHRADASMLAEGVSTPCPGHAIPVPSDTDGPVAPAPAMDEAAVPAPPARPLPPPSQHFAVQVGAFVKLQRAESLSAALRQKGYRPAVVPLRSSTPPARRLWYTVQLGHYTSHHEATQAALTFTRQERSPALVRQRDAL
jgi:cell division septation protein DedD